MSSKEDDKYYWNSLDVVIKHLPWDERHEILATPQWSGDAQYCLFGWEE